jgi:hypothetical protein
LFQWRRKEFFPWLQAPPGTTEEFMSRSAVALATTLLIGSAAAHAAETITYSYDARGRLVTVVRSGPVNKSTTYTLDKADNRVTKSTT